MGWAPYLLAAAPTIISMFDKGPSMPGGMTPVNLPDRSRYQNMLLESAFSPNSDLLKIATERAMAVINSDLANKGLAHSTYGQGAVAFAQAELANKFLEEELQRRVLAFNAATGYDVSKGNLAAGVAANQNQSEWNRYNAERQSKKDMYSGLSGLGQLGLGYMGQRQGQANYRELLDTFKSANAPTPGGYYMAPPTASYGPPPPQYGLGGNWRY